MSTKFIVFYVLGAIGGAAMAMTPELLTAIGALLVAVITAIGAVIVNIMTAVKAVKKLAEENLSETKVVAGHVNSAATAMAGEITGLRKELGLMQVAAADKKEIAAVLAATVAPAQGKVDAKSKIADKPTT